MIPQKIASLLEKYPYEGINRTIIHISFWLIWFAFIWFYTPNNFRPQDTNHTLFFLISFRDWIWVMLFYYFFTRFVFGSISLLSIIFSLIALLIFYVLTYVSIYFSLRAGLIHFPNNTSLKAYSELFFENGFLAGFISRGPFWHITFWYALYLGIPIMIKLIIDISSFRLKNLQLEKANIRLELDYLKSQVNPHFLFNTLNSIYSIVVDSEPKAAEIILKLSDLMRYSLYESNNDKVQLSREIQFIKDYVILEQVRHKKNVDIQCEINGNPKSLEIPPLLLIIFVENAFKHGINNTIKASWIKIKIDISENDLFFRVENSKPQKLKDEKNQGGIGMWNVRKRLDILYPKQYELTVKNNNQSFEVLLNIRLR